uniref:Putative secreted protein n=1 Tax=Anopheles marajoara TaxID=58244 RepID=A0A2M4CBF4_9DIPT
MRLTMASAVLCCVVPASSGTCARLSRTMHTIGSSSMCRSAPRVTATIATCAEWRRCASHCALSTSASTRCRPARSRRTTRS